MSRVHRVGVIAGAGKTIGKTEADFNSHIATIATGGVRAWGTNQILPAGSYRTTASSVSGTMFASSWNDRFAQEDASPCRIIQHASQNQTIFDNQVANGQQVFFKLSLGADKILFSGVTRNGYTSLSYNDGSPYATLSVVQLIRWDRAASKAYTSDPSVGSVESEYTW